MIGETLADAQYTFAIFLLLGHGTLSFAGGSPSL
jgi:hypothetical protein